MDPPFRRVAIVGVGLIGASIAEAARRRWPSVAVTGIETDDDLANVAAADLVILAAPVLTNIRLLLQLPQHLAKDALVTDTGSTKRRSVAAAAELPSVSFIGGHPMAGSARSGAAHARADLFDGRQWILTPDSRADAGMLTRLETFVVGLGATPHVMTADLHDRFVASVSHLPQLTSSALMHVVGSLAGDAGLEIAGAGLVDTTRLAASPPTIWKDVAATNEDALRDALNALIATLTELRDSLATGEAIEAVFTSACRWRDALERANGR
ncbi:MAG TPA: prephenate dehydrogenase/arogenate dehydrogenase family protein [Vicinamibacterales bacterium]|nr:prephenate dehydrogenase/arogenate dehydrogenase family protein [Vicinamibacterales bacterium]